MSWVTVAVWVLGVWAAFAVVLGLVLGLGMDRMGKGPRLRRHLHVVRRRDEL